MDENFRNLNTNNTNSANSSAPGTRSTRDGFFDTLDIDDDFSGEGPDLDDLDLEDISDIRGTSRGTSSSPHKNVSAEGDLDLDGEADLDLDDPSGSDGASCSTGAYYNGLCGAPAGTVHGSAAGTSRGTSADNGSSASSSRTVRELNTAATTLDSKKLKEEQDKKKKKKIKKIIGWIVLEIFTLACIFGYGYFLRAWSLISRPEVDEANIENKNISLSKIQEMEEGYWTFAVFGVDGRSASDLVSKGLNSDVIIIVNISQATGEIRLCSVFRDTYLNISDSDSYRKINAAYCNGGPEQALAALNKNLDLNIKNYVTFNWKAVADGINILGGIDGIELSKAELYYINAFITETVEVTGIGSHQLTSTGVQHLDGVQAVAYGRLRLMDSDFARTERQKKVIKACFEKAKQSSFSVLNNIMVVCFPEVATNINFNTIVAMAQNISKYYIGETGGFPWQRSSSAISSVGDVVVPATLESNVKKLHAFLFDDEDYEPSDAVKRYSAAIAEKTGIYKEGQVVDSVRTDGGLISQPKTTAAEDGDDAAETDAEGNPVLTEEEVETDENGNIIEKPTIGLDEDGNYIYPTDADGNAYIPTDKYGNPVYPTDDYGNIIYETNADGDVVNPTNPDGTPWLSTSKPSELEEDGEEEPGETSHADDGEFDESAGPGGVTKKKTTGISEYGPGSGSTEATTEGYGPGNPAPSTEESTTAKNTKTGTTESSTRSDETVSGSDTPGGSSTRTEETVNGSDSPGGSSSGSTGSSSAPGSGTGSSAPGGSTGTSTGDGPVMETETTVTSQILPGGTNGPGM